MYVHHKNSELKYEIQLLAISEFGLWISDCLNYPHIQGFKSAIRNPQSAIRNPQSAILIT
jgi:hypothetical protein